jgi:5'-3' exonuclease
MGIPSYFSYLVKNYRNIIDIYDKQIKIDHILLDCNSIIYDVFHNLDTTIKKNEIEDEIIKKVYIKLLEYIDLISPKDKIYIAFDGVAPVAKLEQQRNRRYKTQYESKHFSNNKIILWDKAAITPGTDFMNKLNKIIKSKFNNNKKVIFSGSNEAGEGEHKLCQYIRNNPKLFINSNIVIYGLDADLIMLSLLHEKYVKNIYLFRETPDFIKSIDKTLEPNKDYFLNINNFKDIIINELKITNNISDNEKISDSDKNNIIEDYIFICFLLGNDFLPHFPALNIRTTGINTLMMEYQKIKRTDKKFILINNGEIIWKNVKTFIRALSLNETNLIKCEYKTREKKQKQAKYKKHTNENIEYYMYTMKPILDRRVEEYININEDKWQHRYYKILFDIEIDNMRKQQISINYLEGLEWVYKYYTNGCCDWEWKYKYDYPPLLNDLIDYIPYFKEDLIEHKQTYPVDPIIQLIYVLPSQSINLLPPKIIHKLNHEWYTYEDKFKWAFCTYFWESHAILPEIDIDEVRSLLN